MNAAKLRAPNPCLGLTDLAFLDGPPSATTFWVHAKRQVFVGMVRNGWKVNDGRTSEFAVEAFVAALPSLKEPELKACN